jgi:sulfite reductase (NADPH) flavoprotein alpha-component
MIEALDAETRRYAAAGAVALAWLGFCGLIAGREALRSRAKRREAAALLSGAGEPVLVAYASQTGFGEEIARRSAEALQEGGVPARLAPLETLDADTISPWPAAPSSSSAPPARATRPTPPRASFAA